MLINSCLIPRLPNMEGKRSSSSDKIELRSAHEIEKESALTPCLMLDNLEISKTKASEQHSSKYDKFII